MTLPMRQQVRIKRLELASNESPSSLQWMGMYASNYYDHLQHAHINSDWRKVWCTLSPLVHI